MALVRLTDAITPDVFDNYVSYESVTVADMFKSGLVQIDPSYAQKLSGGGRLFQTPVWGDLGRQESSIASDDPAVLISPKKLGSWKHQFVRQIRTEAWSSADLVAELAGSDPQKEIGKKVGAYWAMDYDRRTVATLTGVVNRNVASEGSDMVKDVSALTGTTVIGGQTFNNYQMNPNAIADAKQTMGDKATGRLTHFVTHSVVYNELIKKNLISFLSLSSQEVANPAGYYLGYKVLVTDNVPATVVGPDVIYTSYLVGAGVVRFGASPVEMPSEVKREALQGNGMGVEILVNRQQYAMHFNGYTWLDASVAALFPTDAEIMTAGNWQRAGSVERKAIPFVAIKTKNG